MAASKKVDLEMRRISGKLNEHFAEFKWRLKWAMIAS